MKTEDFIVQPQECQIGDTVAITLKGALVNEAHTVTVTKIELGTGKRTIIRQWTQEGTQWHTQIP